MFIALAGYLVFCMQPSVVTWKETASAKLSWDFALREKLVCKRNVKEGRMEDSADGPLWGPIWGSAKDLP